MTEAVAAVDLGATSGRVMLGFVGHNKLSVRPVARFPNLPIRTPDGLHWNILELFRHVTAGLVAAVHEEASLASAGVDSWAVDYALLRGGRMLGAPFHYRDERNLAAVEAIHSIVSARQLYAQNGLQYLPFNTLYQLEAERDSGHLRFADSMLLIPDLINFWLTGKSFAERTNASTTGLVDITTGEWNEALISRLDLPSRLFAPLVSPGSTVGTLLPSIATGLGMSGNLNIVAVGSHDTASAVVAIPATTSNFAYISCGTWGLVGVELEHPVLNEASRLANFTNEGGVDGRVRYLHNVMGLWLLSESVRYWERSGETIDLTTLLAQASAVSSTISVFDVNDPRFLAPGDMPRRIAEWLTEHDRAVPRSRPEFVRSMIQSLAAAFSDAVCRASELSGIRVDVIHIVGGGSQNELLCQLTADLSGVPVLAGPVEATAIGNVLIQARAQGFATGSLEALRSLVASTFAPKRFDPVH
ncbi:rhamnulokinase family protein [Frigoribacterium sp. UYMn621]|uniref:rhamnulokinase n=1 Tax=Frigoribacterium sp. UYMn621 TaxID=3156343 RepID=UPI0033978521